METAFTRLVGCAVPVQQAPMGSVSPPPLAAAVAAAGGLGTVTALMMSAEQVEAVLQLLAKQTAGAPGAIAVNFLTEQLDRDAVVAAAPVARVIDFFWLDPDSALVQLAHDGGALATWQVGSVDEA